MLVNKDFWVVHFSAQTRLRASGVEAGNLLGIRSEDNGDAGSERLSVTPPFLKLAEIPRIQAGSEDLLTAVISQCEDIYVGIRTTLHHYRILSSPLAIKTPSRARNGLQICLARDGHDHFVRNTFDIQSRTRVSATFRMVFTFRRRISFRRDRSLLDRSKQETINAHSWLLWGTSMTGSCDEICRSRIRSIWFST